MTTAHFGEIRRKILFEGHYLQPYILENNAAVLTRKSVHRYLATTTRLDWLQEFIASFERYGIVSAELGELVNQPQTFKIKDENSATGIETGYDLASLSKICGFILNAKEEGFLNVIELKIANHAQKLWNIIENGWLEWQIKDVTGYHFSLIRSKNRVAEFMLEQNAEPAYKWIRTFPEQFWIEICSWLDLDWKEPTDDKPLADFLQEAIFSRLTQQEMELLRLKSPRRSYRGKFGPIPQEHPILARKIAEITTLTEISGANRSIFDQLLDKKAPRISKSMEFRHRQIPMLGEFDERLKKTLQARPKV